MQRARRDHHRFDAAVEFTGKYVIALVDFLEREPVRDDVLRIDVSGFNVEETTRQVALDARLVHAQREAFIECDADVH